MADLDPDRQYRAGGRARAAAEEQAYHLAQAAGAKAKCDSICATWDLDPVTFQPKSPAEEVAQDTPSE